MVFVSLHVLSIRFIATNSLERMNVLARQEEAGLLAAQAGSTLRGCMKCCAWLFFSIITSKEGY